MRALLAVAALATGCSSGSRPDINDGGVANLCNVAKCTPDPLGVCQHTCSPDPGPRLVECLKAEQPYEFMLPPLWTFDEQAASGVQEPLARGMYSYTDNSTTIKTFTIGSNQATTRARKTWEPRTATMPRCSDVPNDRNQAIHIQGGPFLSWGGGVGIGLKNYPSVVGSVPVADAMKDVSAWEGISFWARRGPDSQAGFRVLVGDKYTDDDISYLMYYEDPTQPRFCERVRECACLNHKTCAAVPLERSGGGTGPITNRAIPSDCAPVVEHLRDDEQEMTFCGTPEVISGAESAGSAGGPQCNTCQQSRCDERWPAYPDDHAIPTAPLGTDRQFYGKPCSPYTLRPGISTFFCFDPATEKPAESTEQCGDHWTRVVNLSNEWQFYTVPFNTMAQQGWAKRSPKLDLTSVSVVRFTWDGGWIDYWIDDVRFYKHKPPPQ